MAADFDSAKGVGAPLDAVDRAILSGLWEIYEQVDPVPPHLTDWLTARVAMDDIDTQICRLIEASPAAVRAAENEATTITFQSTDLTIMLRVDRRSDGSLRVDGWLAPAGASEVELRGDAMTWRTRSDDNGRFSFDNVMPGVAHLVVRTASGGPGDASMGGRRPAAMTQSVVL